MKLCKNAIKKRKQEWIHGSGGLRHIFFFFPSHHIHFLYDFSCRSCELDWTKRLPSSYFIILYENIGKFYCCRCHCRHCINFGDICIPKKEEKDEKEKEVLMYYILIVCGTDCSILTNTPPLWLFSHRVANNCNIRTLEEIVSLREFNFSDFSSPLLLQLILLHTLCVFTSLGRKSFSLSFFLNVLLGYLWFLDFSFFLRLQNYKKKLIRQLNLCLEYWFLFSKKEEKSRQRRIISIIISSTDFSTSFQLIDASEREEDVSWWI